MFANHKTAPGGLLQANFMRRTGFSSLIVVIIGVSHLLRGKSNNVSSESIQFHLQNEQCACIVSWYGLVM